MLSLKTLVIQCDVDAEIDMGSTKQGYTLPFMYMDLVYNKSSIPNHRKSIAYSVYC